MRFKCLVYSFKEHAWCCNGCAHNSRLRSDPICRCRICRKAVLRSITNEVLGESCFLWITSKKLCVSSDRPALCLCGMSHVMGPSYSGHFFAFIIAPSSKYIFFYFSIHLYLSLSEISFQRFELWFKIHEFPYRNSTRITSIFYIRSF